jgi:hypothetical protein
MFHSLMNGVFVSSQLTDILVICKPPTSSRRCVMVGIPASCVGSPDYEYQPGPPRQVFPDFFKYLLTNTKVTS